MTGISGIDGKITGVFIKARSKLVENCEWFITLFKKRREFLFLNQFFQFDQ